MTVLEIYCDECSTPAPIDARIGGKGDGQAIRQLLPAYQRQLKVLHGWTCSGGRDLCPECSSKPQTAEQSPYGQRLWQKIAGQTVFAQ